MGLWQSWVPFIHRDVKGERCRQSGFAFIAGLLSQCLWAARRDDQDLARVKV